MMTLVGAKDTLWRFGMWCRCQETSVQLGPLRGSWVTPRFVRARHIVVIHPGSGPTDRNGNSPFASTNCLLQIAGHLATFNIASLRFDKRGTGSSLSGLAEEEYDIGLLANDLATWTDWTRSHAHGAKIVLLGHSEGGLVATLAAQYRIPDGLVLVAAPGERFGEILERQLQLSSLSGALLDEALQILAELKAGNRVTTVSPELSVLFRTSVQPYLLSMIDLDPALELSRTSCPVLILQGEADLQISPRDAEKLKEVRHDARLVLINDMNHILKTASKGREDNLATYQKPWLPICREAVAAIVSFVRSV